MSDFGKFCLAFAIVVGIILAGGFGFKIGHNRGYSEGYSAPHPSDTTFVIDTHYVDRPVEVIKYKDKERLVYVPITDTVHHYHNDTTYIGFPREYKTYKGDKYEAVVSGVDPILESLKISQKTAYITNTVEKPMPYKWTLSAFGDVGYPLGVRTGLTFDKQVSGPLRWYVQGGYEYNPSYKGVFVQGGVKLDILKK